MNFGNILECRILFLSLNFNNIDYK